MLVKPGDFLFGLIEFLAFIVPGMIVFATAPVVFSWNAPSYLTVIGNPAITPFGWVIFILLSYIYGHFIHHISALLLNPVYQRVYYRRKRREHCGFIEGVEAAIKATMPLHLDIIRVADAYIRCHQATLIPPLEKHEANAKLFRALTLLSVFLCFYPNTDWGAKAILVMLSFLSFLKFAHERWTHRLLAYEYFSLLEQKRGA